MENEHDAKLIQQATAVAIEEVVDRAIHVAIDQLLAEGSEGDSREVNNMREALESLRDPSKRSETEAKWYKEFDAAIAKAESHGATVAIEAAARAMRQCKMAHVYNRYPEVNEVLDDAERDILALKAAPSGTANVDELRVAERDVEVMERCCRAMCTQCAKGYPLGKRGVSHQYGEFSFGECDAAPIRRAFKSGDATANPVRPGELRQSYHDAYLKLISALRPFAEYRGEYLYLNGCLATKSLQKAWEAVV